MVYNTVIRLVITSLTDKTSKQVKRSTEMTTLLYPADAKGKSKMMGQLAPATDCDNQYFLEIWRFAPEEFNRVYEYVGPFNSPEDAKVALAYIMFQPTRTHAAYYDAKEYCDNGGDDPAYDRYFQIVKGRNIKSSDFDRALRGQAKYPGQVDTLIISSRLAGGRLLEVYNQFIDTYPKDLY